MPSTYTPSQVLATVIEQRLEVAKLTGFRTLANMANNNMIRTYNDTDLNWLVDIGGENAAFTGIAATSSTSTTGSTLKGQLTYGDFRLYHRFDINKVDFSVAASRAIDDLADLFGVYTDRAVLALFRKLNDAIFKADGTSAYGNMIGLEKVIDNTYSYAGISPATYPSWKVLKNTSAYRTVTIGTVTTGNAYTVTIDGTVYSYTALAGDDGNKVLLGLQAVIAAGISSAQVVLTVPGSGSVGTLYLKSNPEVTVTGGANVTIGSLVAPSRAFDRNAMLDMDQLLAEQEAMYDMVITTPQIGKNYTQVFDTIAGNLSIPRGGNDNALRSVDLGHSGRTYNGYPLIEDYMASRGKIYMMDSSKVEMLFFSLENMSDFGYAGHNAITNAYSLPLHIWEVPPTVPTVRTFEIFVIPQIRVRNRKAIQVIDNLN